MSDAPIGVFDSGVGGLTVLKALAGELPGEQFIYLGDTARLPYGTKSPETVSRYAVQAAEALASYDIKALVVACNTASAASLPAIREKLKGMPVIGVIEPGADAACRVSKTGNIAVIATEATVRGGAYQEAIQRLRPDARVSARATQLFVALAEEGMHEGPIAESVARHYLTSLFALPGAPSGAGAAPSALVPGGAVPAVPDTLVLGCTHFPMLAGAIRAAIGTRVRIVDSAATTAKAVRDRLGSLLRASPARRSSVRFLATDSPERFARVGSRFLGQTIAPSDVELIDL
ncbi:MAG: glutamate racemase [Steroidobacteraceae bacterium]|nr:glutamate racemase [Steroidobacteraceae bacterium]